MPPNLRSSQDLRLKLCLFCLFVCGMLLAPLAELFVLEFSFHLADVFAGPIVVAFANRALEAN